MNEVTDVEILRALREKSAFYGRMALDLEKQLANVGVIRTAMFGLDSVRDYLKEKSARPADLAKYFSVSEDEIHAVVSAENSGIKVGFRGWLSLA